MGDCSLDYFFFAFKLGIDHLFSVGGGPLRMFS